MTAKKTQDTIVKLRNVRLSYANIYEPKSSMDGKPKFSCNLILDKSDPQVKAIEKAIKDCALAKFGSAGIKLKKALAPDRICLRDGEEKASDGYGETKMFVSASNAANKRPIVVGADKQPITEGEDGAPYSGCYVNANIALWAQDDPKFGQRINANITHVMFWKDGESFSSGPQQSAEDAFDDVEADEDNYGV